MALMDIVNFNADASCLSSEKWLKTLQGGNASRFCRLLDNYIRHRRKVNIGFTGATIRDLLAFNPEAIEKINRHSDIFQILQKSFSHDLSPLRNHHGFHVNLEAGLNTIRRHFQNTVPVFLQNELMIRNQQIETLVEHGIRAIFIHPERYEGTVKDIIPRTPFFCRGTHQAEILTIPISDDMTVPYLTYLHREEPFDAWMTVLKGSELKVIWRDGESALLFPGGVDFEGLLFAEEEKRSIERFHLSEKWDAFSQEAIRSREKSPLRHFPHRKLLHWLSDFKMIWILEELAAIETTIHEQPPWVRKMWLMAINSDIPASSEKAAPQFLVHPDVFKIGRDDFSWGGVLADEAASKVTLLRSERYFEGEVYIDLLHRLQNGAMSAPQFEAYIRESGEPHLQKVFSRVLCDGNE